MGGVERNVLKKTFPSPLSHYSRQEKALPKVCTHMHICTHLCALSSKCLKAASRLSTSAPCPAHQTHKAIQICQEAALSPVKVNSYLWPYGQGSKETHGQLQSRQGWIVTQNKCLLCLPQAMKEGYKRWIVKSPACNIQITQKIMLLLSLAELRIGIWCWQI